MGRILGSRFMHNSTKFRQFWGQSSGILILLFMTLAWMAFTVGAVNGAAPDSNSKAKTPIAQISTAAV